MRWSPSGGSPEDLQILGSMAAAELGEQLDRAAQREVGEFRQHRVASMTEEGATASRYRATGRYGSAAHRHRLGFRTPRALGAAILRYRLYDLDRIISRTLAYGLLTLLLGGGYAAVALALGQLLGRDSSLVVAAATLAMAAVFQPLRRRVQQAMDRRFNRRRHDTAETIAAFSDRLHQQIDLDTLSAELLAVVDQTMQPTQASLWLRPPAGSRALPRQEPLGG